MLQDTDSRPAGEELFPQGCVQGRVDTIGDEYEIGFGIGE